jgi:RHS repeat-associated protein
MRRIDRPDGTALLYDYDGLAMSQETLVGSDTSPRLLASWEYDDFGNVIRTTRGGSQIYELTYDNPRNPRQTTVRDPYGVESVYKLDRDASTNAPRFRELKGACATCGLAANAKLFYDDSDHPLLPSSVVDARGTTTRFTYDNDGQVAVVEEASGTALERTTTYEHAGLFPALVTKIASPSTAGSGSRETTVEYDAEGNPVTITVTGAESGSTFAQRTDATFNEAGLPLSVDPPGHGSADVEQVSYDSSRGDLLPLERIDPLLGTTSFSYDALNRLVSVVDASGVETTWSYDALDRPLEVRVAGTSAADDRVTTFEYTPFGDLSRVTLPEGNVLEYSYDTRGQVVAVERKPDAGTSVERTFIGYNGAGQVTSVEEQRWTGSAWSNEAVTIYLRSSRCHIDAIRYADGTETEYAYDCNGNLERVWDANHPSNNKSAPPTAGYSYDALDRLSTASEPWAPGGSATTKFWYDVRDHLISVEDAIGQKTSYVYSDRDLLTNESSEQAGSKSYRYDEAGDRIEAIDARGIATDFVRDALGRLTRIDLPASELDTILGYEDTRMPGRVTSIVRGGTSLAYAYDRLGQLTSEGRVGYGYDKNGRLAEIRYPNGVKTTYGFDFADRPSAMTLAVPGQGSRSIVAAAEYFSNGPLRSLSLGNGIDELRDFDERYLPTGVEATRGSTALLDWRYRTDAVGNILEITDQVDATRSRLYGYQDVAYFLNHATGSWGELSWEYDRIGNRLAETRGGARTSTARTTKTIGGVDWSLETVTPPSPATPESHWLDGAGNEISEVSSTRKLVLDYGDDNRLARITLDEPTKVGSRTELTYDGRGYLAEATKEVPSGNGWTSPIEAARLRATYGGSTLLHRFSESVPDPADGRQAEHRSEDAYVLYFAGRSVAILYKGTGGIFGQSPTSSQRIVYLTTDHLGTPALTTDESGNAVWSGGLEPYGRDKSGTTSAGEFLRFPGQWNDETFDGTGLTYNLNRWYDNRSGRYTQADPIGLAGGINTYGYAGSRPSRFTDPLGLAEGEWWDPRSYGNTEFVSPEALSRSGAFYRDVVIPETGAYLAEELSPAGIANGVSGAFGYDFLRDEEVSGFWNRTLALAGALPFVPGLARKICAEADALTGLERVAARGGRNPLVQKAAQAGIKIHKTFDYGPGFEREFRLNSGRRIDAINFDTFEIRELKPNNPAAIRRGQKQLDSYLVDLSNQFPDVPWTGGVVTYP